MRVSQTVFLVFILILQIFPSSAINSDTNFPNQEIPSEIAVLERGADYIIKDLGGNKRSWESQSRWVYDGTKYVPYIYSRDEAKSCYNIQVGFVAAKIYDTGVVTIYDPDMNEIRVKSEKWFIEFGKDFGKSTQLVPDKISMIQDLYGVYVNASGTTDKPQGTFWILYSFMIGGSLKHTVKWTSTGVVAVTVKIKQVHDMVDFDKVITDTGTIVISKEVKTEKSTEYVFLDSLGVFLVFENQYSAVYNSIGESLTDKCLQSGNIDFAGKNVIYTFGDWTLVSGESLVVDPDTATLNNPTEDGYILFYSVYTRYNSATSIIIGKSGTNLYRGYVEWDTTSIPDTATITDTVFKYHGESHNQDCHICAIAAKPSTATDANLYADCGDGTVYANPDGFPVTGTNQQVDLGSTADTNLKNLLASNWFAIGITSDNEAKDYNSRIRSEEYATANPKPTLYVVYTTEVHVTVTVTSGPDTGDGYVTVDGAPITTPHNYDWVVDDTYTIAAISPVDIVAGNSRYVYTSWSDAGAQSHVYTVTITETVTANYHIEYYFDVIDAYDSATGEGWYDDGTTTVSSTVSRPIAGGADTQYETTGWSGTGSLVSGGGVGSDTTGVFTINAYTTCTWNWKTQYYLTVSTDPLGIDTPTGEGWYDLGDTAHVSADQYETIIPGDSRYIFDYWTGATGTYTDATVLMTSPKTAIANYIIQYYLMLTTLPVTGPVVTGEGWYDSGTNATLIAVTPYIDGGDVYNFSEWTWNLGGVAQAARIENPTNITMTDYVTAVGVYLIAVSGGATIRIYILVILMILFIALKAYGRV